MVLIDSLSMLSLNLLIIELGDILSNLLNKVAPWMPLNIRPTLIIVSLMCGTHHHSYC